MAFNIAPVLLLKYEGYSPFILAGATLVHHYPSEATITEFILSGKSKREAELAFAQGYDLKERKLRGANFSHAIMYRANFTGADLRGADFTGTKLDEADFTNALLDDAQRKHLCTQPVIGVEGC